MSTIALGSFLGSFGAGVLTFLSPCVLPLAPILTASLLMGDSSRMARFRSTLWFAAGFTVVFVLMGLGFGAVSNALGHAKPALLALAGVILALFGLKMMKVIDTSRHFSWMERSLHGPDFVRKMPRGLHGLLFGALFGFSWTPCVGPVLGGVLTYVASQERTLAQGAALLFAFSLGIAIPLIGIALASEKLMPFLNRLKRHLPRLEYATGLGVFVFSVIMLNQARVETLGSLRPSPEETATTVLSDKGSLLSLGGKTDNVGRMVFFYSSNCPICHAMERFLPQFEQSCSSNFLEFVRVNVDRAENAQAVRRFNVRAVPTVSVFADSGKEIAHLIGYQTESGMRRAARLVGDLVCRGNPVDFPAPKGKSECTVGKVC